MSEAESIAVIGAGSYGTALAIQVARQGRPVRLWGRNAEAMNQMAEERLNARYLPGCPLPETLQPVADLAAALQGATAVIVAVPSHALRETCTAIAQSIGDQVPVACAAKGLEPESCKLPLDVIAEVLGEAWPLAVISGPTFAKEIGQGMPSAVSIGARSLDVADAFAEALHGAGFRAYTTDDIVGVQIGGAVKNVLAIGVGIADGLNLGANTRAALITRGLVEMSRLGEALGARSETLMGLSGMGDLVLTCTDNQSRNRRFGVALARGESVDEAMEAIGQVVEGYRVTREVRELARSLGIEMPITEQVYQVLYEGVAPVAAVLSLSSRPQRAETE